MRDACAEGLRVCLRETLQKGIQLQRLQERNLCKYASVTGTVLCVQLHVRL